MRLPLNVSLVAILSAHACGSEPTQTLDSLDSCGFEPADEEFRQVEQDHWIRVFPVFSAGCGAFQSTLEFRVYPANRFDRYCNVCGSVQVVDILVAGTGMGPADWLLARLDSEFSVVEPGGQEWNPVCGGECSKALLGEIDRPMAVGRVRFAPGQAFVSSSWDVGLEVEDIFGLARENRVAKNWPIVDPGEVSVRFRWPRMHSEDVPSSFENAVSNQALCALHGWRYLQWQLSTFDFSQTGDVEQLTDLQEAGPLRLPAPLRDQVAHRAWLECLPDW